MQPYSNPPKRRYGKAKTHKSETIEKHVCYIPSMLSSILLFQDDEEDIWDDVDSLFTNIPIEETINYSLHFTTPIKTKCSPVL